MVFGVNVSDLISGAIVVGCAGKLSWDVVKEWRKGSYIAKLELQRRNSL